MKLIWLTDIHLNFLDDKLRANFYQELLNASGDVILITGDIAEAPTVSDILREMALTINKPIYFVLGNHDYYQGQITQIRKEMTDLTEQNTLLYWLPAAGPQNLGNGVILLGQDGWADGRYGNYMNSRVSVNDNRLIVDLFQQKILGKHHLLNKMQKLADKDAGLLQASVVSTVTEHKPRKIIILTHVPPFKEVCFHKGKMSGDDFLPFFSSKATGDLLIQIAKENTTIEFLVLCGHTHAKAYWKPYNNLTIKVGLAEYMKPRIQEVISFKYPD